MGPTMVLPLLQFFYNRFVVEHVCWLDKLSTNSLCGNVVWRKCKKKDGDGDKELERGFKGSNILGKGGHRKLNTIVL